MKPSDVAELQQLERELGLAARALSNANSRLEHLLSRYRIRVDLMDAVNRVWGVHGKVKQAAELFSKTH